jgi:uncharacterized damage-inducible protein DinB
MIHTIREFENLWGPELEATQKIFKHLTNATLEQAVNPQGRTLRRMAWHITTTIPEMLSGKGLELAGPSASAAMPSSAKEIFHAYSEVAISLLSEIQKKWTDETLKTVDEMYGRKWMRAFTLQSLIFHQIHHRGQMTVLMRQAGVGVPGIYGPAREEWAAFGMSPPEI